ncbi:MAG: N-acetylmuramoyl-L-alanine amidase [Fusobacteriaceae bacterium]
MKKISIALLSLILFGCSGKKLRLGKQSYKIDDTTYVAKAKNSRIRFIILHYTAVGDEVSIRALTGKNVSSHYLITSKKKDPIYSLVPDLERAWHAGSSGWNGRTNLNDSSIGIEIVNLGYDTNIKYGKTYGNRNNLRPADHFYNFDQYQIDKVAVLVKELKEKYEIDDKNILGHSDIAPQRKFDPGPKFPWKKLYDQHKIGVWYDQKDKNFFYNSELFFSETPASLMDELKKYGYSIDVEENWSEKSEKVVYAFQHHFRPDKTDGIMDLETYSILKALNKKYKK